MTLSGDRPEARGERQGAFDSSHQSRSSDPVPLAPRLVALACLLVALACVLWGLRQLDGPTARYLRTITTPEGGGTLTIPWMAFVSHAGNWMGDGRQLLIVSAILLAAGWLLPATRGLVTGVQSLWAHGLATVLVHTVKHLVGRPRPKFSATGDWSIAPSRHQGTIPFRPAIRRRPLRSRLS